MTNPVDVLAEGFRTGLTHPGRPAENLPAKVISLPALRNTGIPQEQAAQFAQEAGISGDDTPLLLAEAAVNTLAESGLTIIPTGELQQLKTQAADAPDGIRTVTVYDRTDSQLKNPRLGITVGKTDHIIVDVAAWARALTAPSE